MPRREEAGAREAPCQDTRVVEAHPEVSFATLAGAPLTERKTSWAGAVRRRRFSAERPSTEAEVSRRIGI